MERAASEYYLWSLEGKPVSVHLSLDVVHALQPAAGDSPGDRPVEHGGVLLGRVRQVNESYIVSVDAAELLPCEHTRGASWTLSGKDKQALLRKSRRQQGSRTVVGWFRTHTRPGLYLDQHDFNLFTEFFAHPSSISLLIRPEDLEAAFFFWENGDIRRSAPYQTFPFIPQALGTRHERAKPVPPPVELVAVPAGAVAPGESGSPRNVWVRRAIYAAPIAAGILAGFYWQPQIERRRIASPPVETQVSRTERPTFTSPEPLEPSPMEPLEVNSAPSDTEVVEDAPAVRKSRPKPARRLNVTTTRPARSKAPEPVMDAQPPTVVANARLDTVPVPADRVDVPEMRDGSRDEKPSKVRRVLGSIPLLGFLKKKKQPKPEEDAVSPRRVSGSVASALTSPEASLSSPRPARSPDSAVAPRTAAPVAR